MLIPRQVGSGIYSQSVIDPRNARVSELSEGQTGGATLMQLSTDLLHLCLAACVLTFTTLVEGSAWKVYFQLPWVRDIICSWIALWRVERDRKAKHTTQRPVLTIEGAARMPKSRGTRCSVPDHNTDLSHSKRYISVIAVLCDVNNYLTSRPPRQSVPKWSFLQQMFTYQHFASPIKM